MKTAKDLGLVVTGYYKRNGKCYVTFFRGKNVVNYEVSEEIYKSAQKRIRRLFRKTNMRGAFLSTKEQQNEMQAWVIEQTGFPF